MTNGIPAAELTRELMDEARRLLASQAGRYDAPPEAQLRQ
jgi:hypothetical protein